MRSLSPHAQNDENKNYAVTCSTPSESCHGLGAASYSRITIHPTAVPVYLYLLSYGLDQI